MFSNLTQFAGGGAGFARSEGAFFWYGRGTKTGENEKTPGKPAFFVVKLKNFVTTRSE